MSKIVPGIGLIGFGWMGRSHSRAYRNIEVYFPESHIRPRRVAEVQAAMARSWASGTWESVEAL